MSDSELSIAIPNKGRLHDAVRLFLERCSLRLDRESERQYSAPLKGTTHKVRVAFQRARDVPKFVSRGEADLGITGYDLLAESGGHKDTNLYVVFDTLGFSACELAIAVPDHWVHVSNIGDLAELAMRWRDSRKHEHLRVATEFPNLTTEFLIGNGVTFFKIVEVSGAAESAPKMGAADIISDLKESGNTLVENRLKSIGGGTILKSAACLFARLPNLRESNAKADAARVLFDRIESCIEGRTYYMITANVDGESEKDVAQKILRSAPESLTGAKGPTIAPVYMLNHEDAKQRLFSVSIIVRQAEIEAAIEHLGKRSGTDILVSNIDFVYNRPPKYEDKLNKVLPKMRKS